MGDLIKSGYIKRYSKSFLNGGWNKSFLQLHRDSTLRVYKKQGDSNCQGSIYMKDVCKYFAYGEYTAGMPDRPNPPSGSSYDAIMGIPQKPNKNAKIHWFLFSSTNELHSWMTAICSVLPPPPQSHQDHQPQQHQKQQQQHQQYHAPAPPPQGYAPAPPPYTAAAVPPSGYAAAPPPPAGYHPPPPQPGPSLGFENLTLGGAPAHPPHPQAAHPPYPPAGPAPPPQYGPPPPAGAYYPAQPYSMPPQAAGGYPQQQYYPQPAGYPQQQYHQQPTGYAGYAGYPQQAYGYQYQQQPQVIYTQGKPKKMKSGGVLGGNTGKMAAGVAGGALLGYGASRMMGGGWGLGRWGSWSSIGSFGSFSSCGSFGSFGSFGS